jgi:hypothetical protein
MSALLRSYKLLALPLYCQNIAGSLAAATKPERSKQSWKIVLKQTEIQLFSMKNSIKKERKRMQLCIQRLLTKILLLR